jgi:hypothetical protein
MFFRLFGKRKAENPEVTKDVFVDDEDPVIEEEKENVPLERKSPMARVFTYLNEDYEGRGYLDAVSCPDQAYKNLSKKHIKDKLGILVREVSLEYTDQSKKLDFLIVSRTSSGLMDIVKSLQMKKETIDKHLAFLSKLMQEVESNSENSPLAASIDSYERGFMRGLASGTFDIMKEESV